jgi:hypothetical protein
MKSVKKRSPIPIFGAHPGKKPDNATTADEEKLKKNVQLNLS